MNTKQATIALAFLFSAIAIAAPLTELTAARTRYDSAIAAATKPVRERYILELEQLKSRAMAQKNLDLAVAIDTELNSLVVVAPKASAIETPVDLARFLEGTSWSWGANISDAGSRLTFQKDGTFIINNDKPLTWTADTANTVTLAPGAKLKFSGDYKRYEGTSASGAPRAGKRISSGK